MPANKNGTLVNTQLGSAQQRRLLALAAIAAACMHSELSAADTVSIRGLGGTTTCQGWIEHRLSQDPIELALLNWVLGYISGAAQFLHTVPTNTSNLEIVGSIDTYCQEHPTEPMFKAALSLVERD